MAVKIVHETPNYPPPPPERRLLPVSVFLTMGTTSSPGLPLPPGGRPVGWTAASLVAVIVFPIQGEKLSR